MKVLIICDTFNIGGIQRLALDQAYSLSNRGIQSEILVLSSKEISKFDSFELNEANLIKEHNIKISYLPGKKFEQMMFLKNIISSNYYSKIFAHSLRGGVITWLLCRAFRYKVHISTIIHQLPSFSSPVQRFKRMLYSQFCDNLYIFSVAAKNDWASNQSNNFLFRFITQRRKVLVCRNGVYLPRLEYKIENTGNSTELKRLIFIGRLTAWKGLNTFLKIAQLEQFKKLEFLIMSPSDPHEFLSELDIDTLNRITCVIGKSVSQINFYPGDLLLYPADYGKEKEFIEGVSINVLEMACIGVPSIISKGAETWPELFELGIFQTVDWTDIRLVANLIQNNFKIISSDQVLKSRKLIDIKNNLDVMLQQ
jgi:glycosyltransferase involved in cell wall biosynthesis